MPRTSYVMAMLFGLALAPMARAAPAGPAACAAWQSLAAAAPARHGVAPVYDATNDRVIVFGGYDDQGVAHGDVWALSLAAGAQWTALAPAGPAPEARGDYAAAYDPAAGGALVIYGGRGAHGDLGDAWTLPLSGASPWRRLDAAGGPAPRQGASMVCDAARRRLVIFGGRDDATVYGETWRLTLVTPTWNLIAAGPGPGARCNHVAVTLDAARDQMVVIGGRGGEADSTTLGDVWSLALADGGGWSPLTPQNYSTPMLPRAGASAVWDAPRQRVLVFGGTSWDGAATADVSELWGLSFLGNLQWILLRPGGAAPAPRAEHGAVYDAAHQRMVVTGGRAGAGVVDAGPFALALSGTFAWSQPAAAIAAPAARSGAGACLDAGGGTLLLGGGAGSDGATLGDWWRAAPATGAWTPVVSAANGPSARRDASVVFDAARRRAIVFGGAGDDGVPLDDLWALTLDGAPNWTALSPDPGDLPAGPRAGHVAVLDAARDRMLVCGGMDATGSGGVWALALAGDGAWSYLPTTGDAPPNLTHAAAVLDGRRDRMLLLGGADSAGAVHGEVWSLDLADNTWSRLAPPGRGPSPGVARSAVWDSTRDRVLVFGGDPLESDAPVYELALAGAPAWGRVACDGTTPAARAAHAGWFDAASGRMLAFGGAGAAGTLADLVALAFDAQAPALRLVATPDTAGAATADPPGACYGAGTTITLHAVPRTGYVFAGWNASPADTLNPRVLTLARDTTIVAHFAVDQTPVLLALFDATTGNLGVTLRWEFGDRARVAQAQVERAADRAGPWSAPALELHEDRDGATALDRTAAAGGTWWYRLRVTLINGASATFGPIAAASAATPVISAILSLAPNPSPGAIAARVALARAGHARVTIVDVAGRIVATLLDGDPGPGVRLLRWDGRTPAGRAAPGLYALRLAAPDRVAVAKFAVIR